MGKINRARRHVDAYIEERVRRRELVASSAGVTRTVLLHWHRQVEHRSPRMWTEHDVTSWVFDPAVRPNTSKSRLTKLRPYLRWLIVNRHLDRDPAIEIGRIRVPDGDPRDLDPEEVTALIAQAPDQRGRTIVIVRAQTGIRCSSIAWARIEDINRRHQRLHVRAKGGGGEPTYWVPVPDEAWEALEPWIGTRRSGPLFASYTTGQAMQPGTISKMVGRWMRDAGLKAFPYDGTSAHALRHTTAQHMIDNGAQPRDVQYALGHKSIRTGEIYTRREPRGLREAMEGRRYAA